MNIKFIKISAIYKITLSLIIFFGFGSCSKEEESEETIRMRQDLAAIEQHIEANQVIATKGSSEYFFSKIQENPDGTAPVGGSIIYFYYKVFLLDGTEIASYTAEDGNPVVTRHGTESVFPVGIDFAFQHIKKGEILRAYLPSALAFYQYSNTALPPYSNIILEVEVVDILTADQQKAAEIASIEQYIADNELDNVNKLTSGLHYKILEAGSGAIPVRGNSVTVAYEGSLMDGTVFDKSEEGKPFEFTLGANQVIPGWEQGIPLMQKDEKSILIIPSHLAYGETFTVVPNSFKNDLIEKGFIYGSKVNVSRSIPPFSVLIFNVTLEDIR